VTDEGLKQLADVKSLVMVRIAAGKVSPEAVAKFQKALPNVSVAMVGEAGWHFITPAGDEADMTPMP
jgi:hypothetical protein